MKSINGSNLLYRLWFITDPEPVSWKKMHLPTFITGITRRSSSLSVSSMETSGEWMHRRKACLRRPSQQDCNLPFKQDSSLVGFITNVTITCMYYIEWFVQLELHSYRSYVLLDYFIRYSYWKGMWNLF